MSKRPRDPEEQEAEAAAIRAREDRDDPVSLEDLLHAKKEEQMELSKPIFLTPEDRAAIAIRRREAQMAAKRAQQEEEANRRHEQREKEREERSRMRGQHTGRPTETSTDQKVLE